MHQHGEPSACLLKPLFLLHTAAMLMYLLAEQFNRQHPAQMFSALLCGLHVSIVYHICTCQLQQVLTRPLMKLLVLTHQLVCYCSWSKQYVLCRML